MKITLKSHQVYHVLNDALQFTSPTDGGIPAIEAVRLETSPNDTDTVNLIGVGTDRFVLGASRASAVGDAGLGVTLSADDVKSVLRIAKTVRRDESWREVTVHDAGDAGVTFTFTSGESLTVRQIAEQFPAWRQLITLDNVVGLGVDVVGLGVDPRKVAQFSRIAAAKSAPMQLFATLTKADGPGGSARIKPIHVRVGDDFYGLLMPVRSPDAQLFTYGRPAWLS